MGNEIQLLEKLITRKPNMWEYKVHKFKVESGLFTRANMNVEHMEDAYNHYGKEGWELVSVMDINSFKGESGYIVATFKRAFVSSN